MQIHCPPQIMIAESVNTNAVVIRRILGMLKNAGLVDMKRGTGGSYLTKPIEDISLLEVYKAVDVVKMVVCFKFIQIQIPIVP